MTSVSAIVPVYNRAHLISRAVESILSQTQRPDEILIVDDGSDDDPAAALARFGSAVRTLRLGRNSGAAGARNHAIEVAAGEYLAFLDSDDLWEPDKLERQLRFMEDARLEASCTGFSVFPPLQPELFVPARRRYPERLELRDISWGCYTAPGSTLVMRAALARRLGGYDAELRHYEDWDLLLRLLAPEGRGLGFLDRPLSRVEAGNRRTDESVLRSLAAIESRHQETAARRGLSARFRSGLAFNRAALWAARGKHMAMAVELVRSIALHPFGHWPATNVLFGRLQRPRLPRRRQASIDG